MSRNQSVTEAGKQGQEILLMTSAAARTKGDVVRIGSSSAGLLDVTLADDTDVYKLAVANQDIASGVIGEYVVKGEVTCTVTSDNYTAGHGLHMLNGTVLNSDATAEKPNAAPANNDFAVVITGGTAVTEVVAYLYGDPITAQT